MKAIYLREPGGTEQLRIEELPDPEPRPGEVLVKLEYAAVNRRDIWLRSGPQMQWAMPFVPGSDGAGVIAGLGEGVVDLEEAQEVVIYPCLNWGPHVDFAGDSFEILGGPTDGTYASLIRIPAENVLPKPSNISFEEAAAFPLAGLTAWRALVTKAKLIPGESLLIPGIGSGVATFALQIGKLLGASVFITSHLDEKLERARALGADGGANYTKHGWEKAISQLTGSVDVVLDSVGSATFGKALDLLRPGGRVVTLGATTGADVAVNLRTIYRKQISVLGTMMGTLEEFHQVLRAIENGQLRAIVDRVFPLEHAHAAHLHLENRNQFGKVVLRTN